MIYLDTFHFISAELFHFKNVVTQFITKNVKQIYVHGKCIEYYCDARKNWWKAKSFFVHVYSEKFNTRISRPLHTRVQWAWRLFLFFHCIQKQFMERVANFLFSFPLLLFYSNSFRRRVLLPTQLWGKKGIYQQSLFM